MYTNAMYGLLTILMGITMMLFFGLYFLGIIIVIAGIIKVVRALVFYL